MGSPIVRMGPDNSAGADRAPPTTATGGSSNVEVNGKPVVRVGDAYSPHKRPKQKPHGRTASGGSSTVEVNGKPVHRVGDAISCGDFAAAGSSNVEAG